MTELGAPASPEAAGSTDRDWVQVYRVSTWAIALDLVTALLLFLPLGVSCLGSVAVGLWSVVSGETSAWALLMCGYGGVIGGWFFYHGIHMLLDPIRAPRTVEGLVTAGGFPGSRIVIGDVTAELRREARRKVRVGDHVRIAYDPGERTVRRLLVLR